MVVVERCNSRVVMAVIEKVVEETCKYMVEVMIGMMEEVMAMEVVMICRYREARVTAMVVVVVIYTNKSAAVIVMEAGRTCGDVVAL